MTYANTRAEDEAKVRALADELVQGWNAGDGTRFAAAFTEDGDLVGFDGTFLRGRTAIEAFQQQLFDRWMKGTRLTGRVVDVRFVGPDTAVVHVVGGTIMRGKNRPARARDSIQTMIGDALWGLFRLSTDPSGAIGAR